MLNDAITIGCCEKRFKLSSDLESLTMMIDKISDNPIFDYDSRVKDECGTRCKNKCIIIENLEEYNYMNKHGAIVCEHPLFIVPESNFIIYRKELKFVNLLTKEEFFKPVQFITNIDNDEQVLKYYNHNKERLERQIDAVTFTNSIKRSNVSLLTLYDYQFLDIYNSVKLMTPDKINICITMCDFTIGYTIDDFNTITVSKISNDNDTCEELFKIKFYEGNKYFNLYTKNNEYIYNIFKSINYIKEVLDSEEYLYEYKDRIIDLIRLNINKK